MSWYGRRTRITLTATELKHLIIKKTLFLCHIDTTLTWLYVVFFYSVSVSFLSYSPNRKRENFICIHFIFLSPEYDLLSDRFHGVMVSTLDSESSDPSSSLGGTLYFHILISNNRFEQSRVDGSCTCSNKRISYSKRSQEFSFCSNEMKRIRRFWKTSASIMPG